jgi:hypothetical protein
MKCPTFGYRTSRLTFIHTKRTLKQTLLIIVCLSRFLAAIQDILPNDDHGQHTLANNQILYPLCVKCLEKFENDPEQSHNRDFAEICLLIVR